MVFFSGYIFLPFCSYFNTLIKSVMYRIQLDDKKANNLSISLTQNIFILSRGKCHSVINVSSNKATIQCIVCHFNHSTKLLFQLRVVIRLQYHPTRKKIWWEAVIRFSPKADIITAFHRNIENDPKIPKHLLSPSAHSIVND